MLKGILFVIAIIVTFDIGKTLIDSYRAKQAQEDALKEQKEAATKQEKLREESKPEIDLSLPKGIEFEDEGATNTEEPEEDPKALNNIPSNKEESKVSVSAKPLVDIDYEEKEAELNGASVGVKVDL
jgi:hypothetical protein